MTRMKALVDHEDSVGILHRAGQKYDEFNESVVLSRLRTGKAVRVQEVKSFGEPIEIPPETKTLDVPPLPVETKVLSAPVKPVGGQHHGQ